MRRWLLLLPFLLLAHPAQATSTITRVGSCVGTGGSCTPPAHQPGDLFIAYNSQAASATPPGTPAGWISIVGQAGSGTDSHRVSCKFAITNAETATGFTGNVIVLVYRGVLVTSTNNCSNAVLIGTPASGSASSATLSYNTITLADTGATSWVIGCGFSKTASNVATAPTGMTNVTSTGSGTVACHDTNAPASAWTTQTVGVNANDLWMTYVLEVRACTTIVCMRDFVTGSAAGSTTTVPSSAASHLAGNKLVAFVQSNSGARHVTGVANTASDTWALCSGSRETTQFDIEAWETTGATNTNASDIATATMDMADTFKTIWVVEVTGASLNACETAAIANCASCTSITSASFSPSHIGNYNFALAIATTAVTTTAGTSYIPIGNNGNQNLLEYRVTAPAGSQTATFTMGSTTMGMSVGSFFPANNGGAGGQVGGFLVGP